MTGCDSDEPPEAGLNAQVVAFDPAGFNGPPLAAIIDSEDSARLFAGWLADRVDSGAQVPEVMEHLELRTDFDTTTYLAIVASTGCRAPTRAELRRVGNDLRPELIGGIDHPECVRAYTPFVVYRIRRTDVDGVTTVGGEPADRDGPAELVARIEFGATPPPDLAPREITDPADRTALADELARAGIPGTAQIPETLSGPSALQAKYGPEDIRRYAFPLRSCPHEIAALRITPTELRAQAVTPPGGPDTCEAPT